jgi:hypothetical protein
MKRMRDILGWLFFVTPVVWLVRLFMRKRVKQ